MSPEPAGWSTCLAFRDIALRCPRRVQRRNFSECQCRSEIRFARYYAGGDGAARHPYHWAKHIPRRTERAADTTRRMVRQGDCCRRVGGTPTAAVETCPPWQYCGGWTTALPICNCIVP